MIDCLIIFERSQSVTKSLEKVLFGRERIFQNKSRQGPHRVIILVKICRIGSDDYRSGLPMSACGLDNLRILAKAQILTGTSLARI